MVIQVSPKEVDYDTLALRVFLKALEIIGGPRKLFEYRNLTWIPSLMEAAYAVVLKEEGFKTEDEIAEFIGITKQTVRNILSADPEVVLLKLQGELEAKDVKVHTAGGLAKLAYQEVKAGRDYIPFVISVCETYVSKLLGIAWPVEVLTAIKGMDFPVDETKKDELKSKLVGIRIKDYSAPEVIDRIEFPIKSPADLLHKLSEAVKG
ncbi:putative regulatory domain-containing [Desulfurobacterium thermolithotrophum DSM 11699]|uniref:Putative regulatory domain-containing n=1 Tax=Desulfurobacterium thermolithotrophum (strain DSM 11699 / BSA) TaxID=868864 RepID=F0S2Y8_DESTD|nr:regulatory domain-containing [Desulfurobacterium thermolithotrophum]ADY73210.1 putative regulatory domain-containing [Desulfurobacterium thermolithotrophum DSM 11699]